MKRILGISLLLAVAFGVLTIAPGCGPKRRPAVPEQDLTPYQMLHARWTRDFVFRRTAGGDDLVTHSDAIIERPTHERRLHLSATLYADTLVQAEIEQLCEIDTTGTSCEEIVELYTDHHRYPEWFRIDIRARAQLEQPFALEPLVIYITDANGIDYEPAHRLFSDPVTEQRSYVDHEVRRYDPYTAWEYREFGYRYGYEYASSGRATLYFRRINVIGKDILAGDNAKVTLNFRRDRSTIAQMSWDISETLERARRNAPLR